MSIWMPFTESIHSIVTEMLYTTAISVISLGSYHFTNNHPIVLITKQIALNQSNTLQVFLIQIMLYMYKIVPLCVYI